MNESEVKPWLKTVLKNENIEDFSVRVEGTSEKGDGYSGEIIFVSLKNDKKNYNLALKCSSSDNLFTQNIKLDKIYKNEMYVYEKVFPEFTQFQLEKGISDYFNCVPKCYGTLSADNREIIVLENLKRLGYTLWNKKKPLTRKHIEMLLVEYAKFHAVSIAMNDQQPEKFEKLKNGTSDYFRHLFETGGMANIFANRVDEVCSVLQDELDETVLEKWKKLKDKFSYIYTEMADDVDGVKVILHGDSWCNNFLFKHVAGDENEPSNVAILDWQLSRFSTPVFDLSYFILTGISKEDIKSLDAILQHYHSSLGSFLRRLGSNVDLLYPYEQFKSDWNKYCKYGIATCCMVAKVCATDKDEVVENGADLDAMFSYDIKDKTTFKDRTKHIVKYAVENDLI